MERTIGIEREILIEALEGAHCSVLIDEDGDIYIEPGSPWENGYCESFNSKLRDELLEGEQFSTLTEAQVLIGR